MRGFTVRYTPFSALSLFVFFQHLFSAILNRDQAYQSILDQGMILGLPWGTDIHMEVRRRGVRVRSDRGSSPGLSDSSRSLSTEEGERASLTRED